MNKFIIIILLCSSFTVASCDEAIVNSKATKDAEIIEQEGNQVDSTSDLNKQSLVKNKDTCQTETINQDSDSKQNAETVTTPNTRTEFNEWLDNLIGSVQVATLPNRKFINEYYWEGDLNNDGCGDVAIIIESAKDSSINDSADNLKSSTIIQNLLSKTTYKNSEKIKIPLSKIIEKHIKPTQENAIAVVFGGQNGWSQKHSELGKEFLLYDSIFVPSKTSDYEATSTLFNIVKKNKPNEDDDDLLELIPSNAVGDCIYTATEFKYKKNKFSELNNKFLICFDGNNFFNVKLPDSKLYPEL